MKHEIHIFHVEMSLCSVPFDEIFSVLKSLLCHYQNKKNIWYFKFFYTKIPKQYYHLHLMREENKYKIKSNISYLFSNFTYNNSINMYLKKISWSSLLIIFIKYINPYYLQPICYILLMIYKLQVPSHTQDAKAKATENPETQSGFGIKQ